MEMTASTNSSQTNLVMGAWTQSIAQVRKEISTKSTNSSPHTKKALEYLERSTLPGIQETIHAKRRSLQCSWLALLILANGACLIHLFFLLETFVEQPNGVSMRTSIESEFVLPRIHICQPPTNMLDMSLMRNVSYEQFFALDLSVGLVRTDISIWQEIPIMNMTAVEEYLSLVAEDPVGAYKQFINENTLQCGDLFDKCVDSNDEEFDCCQVFERVFTLRGACWASKKGALKISEGGFGSLNTLKFKIKDKDNSKYFVSLADFLDQSDKVPETYTFLGYDTSIFKLKQHRRTSLPESSPCVVDKDENLDYFIDYSVSNCQLERNLLKELYRLLNDTCELPLVELLKPGYKSEKLCNYTQILALFNYHSIGQVPLIDDYIDEYSQAAGHDLRPLMVEGCDVWFNQSALSRCSPIDVKEALRKANSTSANEMASKISSLNTVPKTFQHLLTDLENLRKNSDDQQKPCLYPCDITEHDYRLITKSALNLSDNPAFDFTIEYITRQVVTFAEEPRQSLSEYIALIGGNISMWNGATVVSLGHFFALSLNALGFRPFH